MQQLRVDVPESYRFPPPTRTPNMRREEEILRPTANVYASDGDNVIRFILPKKNIDFRQGYLTFAVTLSATGSTYKRIAQGAFSLIRKIRWFVGSVDQSIDYYNRIQSFVYALMVNSQTVTTIGQDLLGFGTQADRNAKGTVTTVYSIPINVGIFSTSMLPLASVERDCDFCVEITLENPLWCIETDGTNPNFSITNVRWHYHSLKSEDGSYERSMAADVSSGKLAIGYGQWVSFQSTIENNIIEARINWQGVSLSNIISYVSNQAEISNPLINDKFITWPRVFGGVSVKDFQLMVRDGLWLPPEPIDCSNEAIRAFHQFLDLRGLWSITGESSNPSPVDLDSFNFDQFFMVNNLSIIPKEYGSNRFSFNQLSTRTSANNTILRVNLTGAPPAQHVLYHFIYHGVLFNVTPAGKMYFHN